MLLDVKNLYSGPTSLFWTTCTTDVQPYGVGHVSITSYFSLYNQKKYSSNIPTDVGFELGILSWNGLKGEAGIDYLAGTSNPFYFNAKIGMDESSLFNHSPSFCIGFSDVGTKTHGKNRTNQNILNAVIGKSLPEAFGGNLYVGAYFGSQALGRVRQGVMAGYSRGFDAVTSPEGVKYSRWYFLIDYASGNNAIGGAGVALTYNFNPAVYIQTGPVWFYSKTINGAWKWSIQLNIDFSLFDNIQRN